MLKNNRSPLAAEDSLALERGRFSSWIDFWFTAADPLGLHWLRFLACLLFLSWLLPLAGHVDAFFSMEGWFDRQAYLARSQLEAQANRQPGEDTPAALFPLWSTLWMVRGLSSATLHLVFWGSMAVLALFGLGIATRLTGLLTWLVVGSFMASPASNGDADYLLVIPALYLMVGYLFLGQWNRRLSGLERLLGPWDCFLPANFRADRDTTPSYAATLAVRLFQVHFAFLVVMSGLHKLQIGSWWGGVAFWYPLTPPFGTTMSTLEARQAQGNFFLFFISLTQYLMLAWQIGFPLFAWRRGWWRVILLGGGALGWIGSVFIFQTPVLGPFFLLGCLSYLAPETWVRLTPTFWAARSAPRRSLLERPERILKLPAKT